MPLVIGQEAAGSFDSLTRRGTSPWRITRRDSITAASNIGDASVGKLLTPEDVSDLLGIPVKTLANWRSERVGPLPLRIGCHVRYRSSDVEAWLSERVAAAKRWMAS
ncbi:MAG TPA: helix-turn-helix domain-containing protein [Nocardioidaceae bacterium]|nr:helix-turn-helix domain-containing protein [Nocardioidaceae bacterium]